MTIVLTGGSGFIGTQLAKKLLALGDTVVVVDIKAPSFTHEQLFFIQCDITRSELPFNVLEHTDAVINLAGAPISAKWTDSYKQVISDSRIISTRHIVESMRTATSRPTILINASAIGYYGEREREELTERSAKGVGFLADVVAGWEAEAQKAEEFGTRVVCMRTAPVVGHGGMLTQMRMTAKFGFLMKLTTNKFFQSWVHEEDIVHAYLFALQTSTLQGPVNVASPEVVTHDVFMKTLGVVLKRPVLGSAPSFILTLKYGLLMAELTKSQCVSPKLLIDKGFVFQHPTLEGALLDAVTTY